MVTTLTDGLRRLYWRVRAAFPINRVVVLLTPVFAAVAGSVTAWLAERFPGVALDEASLTGLFLAGAAAAVAAAYKWLDNWSEYEARFEQRYMPPLGEIERQQRKDQPGGGPA